MSARKLLTTMVVSFAATLVSGCGGEEDPVLLSVRSQKEAIEILDALDRAGVYAEKESATEQRQTVWRIEVPRSKLRTARKALLRGGLPRDSHGGYREMLDKSGMFPNRTDERARLMRAQSEELATTLEHYGGIIGARVHVILPEKDRGRGHAQPPTASVMIRYTPQGEKDDRASAKRALESDPYPYSVPVPPALSDPQTAASGDKTEGGAQSGDESTSPAKGARSNDEGPSKRARPAGGEGVRRDLEKDGNSDWPLAPSAVCWQIANGVEGLEPWNVTVMYSRAPNYQLPAGNDESYPEGMTPAGNASRAKLNLYRAASALFGTATILLAFLHVRLRRRLV